MSRKPVHLRIDMPVLKRLRYLFSSGRIDILFQPTMLGSVKVVDVIIAGKSNTPEVPHGAAKPD